MKITKERLGQVVFYIALTAFAGLSVAGGNYRTRAVINKYTGKQDMVLDGKAIYADISTLSAIGGSGSAGVMQNLSSYARLRENVTFGRISSIGMFEFSGSEFIEGESKIAMSVRDDSGVRLYNNQQIPDTSYAVLALDNNQQALLQGQNLSLSSGTGGVVISSPTDIMLRANNNIYLSDQIGIPYYNKPTDTLVLNNLSTAILKANSIPYVTSSIASHDAAGTSHSSHFVANTAPHTGANGHALNSAFSAYTTGQRTGSATQFRRADGTNQTLTAVGSGSGLSTNSRVGFANVSTLGLSADGKTLYVDSVNHKVGFGTKTPISKINMLTEGSTMSDDFRQRGPLNEYFGNIDLWFGKGGVVSIARGTKAAPTAVADGANASLLFPQYYDGTKWRPGSTIFSYTSGAVNNTSVYSHLRFYSGNVTGNTLEGTYTGLNEQMRLDWQGNLLFGTTDTPTSSTKSIVMKSGTAPSASVTDSVSLYSQDQTAGAAMLHIRDELGTVTRLGKVSSFPNQVGIGTTTTTPRSGYGFDSYSSPAIVGSTANAVIVDKKLGGVRLKGRAVAFDDLQFVVTPKDNTGVSSCHPALTAFLTPLEEYLFSTSTVGCPAGEYQHVSIASVELPHNWTLLPDTTNALGQFHMHLSTGSGSWVAGNKVRWKLSVSCANLTSGVFQPVRDLFAQYSASSTVAPYTSAYLSFGNYTKASCAAIGTQMKTRMARVPKRAGGTDPASDPFLMQLGLHHAIDGFGSDFNSATSPNYGQKTPTP